MVGNFEMGNILQSHMPNRHSTGHGKLRYHSIQENDTHTHTIEQYSKSLIPLNHRDSSIGLL